MLLIETVLVLLCVTLSFIHPSIGSRLFTELERRLAVFSQRRTGSAILAGTFALLLRVAVLPIEPIPQPTIPDEFSFLLMSDTFAHGSLPNSTRRMGIDLD